MTTALKNCPFCGGEAEAINSSVHCNNAFCEAQPFTAGQSQEEAIAAWNRRAALAAPAAVEREALESIAGDLQIMLGSAKEHDDGQWTTGYTIKTGALHRIIGTLAAAGLSVSLPNGSPALEEQADALETLEQSLRHFTRTPSSLADTTARGNAHAAIATLRAALSTVKQTPAAQCDGGTCGIGGYCDECTAVKQTPYGPAERMDVLMDAERLHAAIMNLPVGFPHLIGKTAHDGYKIGHRDARHAAAALLKEQP